MNKKIKVLLLEQKDFWDIVAIEGQPDYEEEKRYLGKLKVELKLDPDFVQEYAECLIKLIKMNKKIEEEIYKQSGGKE